MPMVIMMPPLSRERDLLTLKIVPVQIDLCDFVGSYLAPRKGKVVVQGASSEAIALEDSVFQGTVLGFLCKFNSFLM